MASLSLSSKKGGFNRKSNNNKFIIPAIIIVMLAAILLLSMGGTSTITQATTVTLKQGSAMQFRLSSSSDVFSIYVNGVSSSSAELSISQSPVLSSEISSFTLISGSTINVSTTGDKDANLQVTLVSGNSSTAKLQLTPISSGLVISSSPGISSSQPLPIPQNSSNILSTIPTTIINSQGTTTTSSATTSLTTGATTSQVTTISPNQNIPQSVINEAESSYIGTLVSNLDALYAKEVQCTEPIYNQTLTSLAHQSPTGPFSYANVTLHTPNSINMTITGPISSNYTVNYASKGPSKQTTGLAISMTLNGTSGTISNIKFSGIFLGANYTNLQNSYTYQSSLGTACGAYMPYS